MKVRDWYFQGWERRADENGKSVFVYTGEYYTFPGGIGAVRGPSLALTAALLALFLIVALLPSPGGMWHYAAIPQLLELIPLIYLVIGGVCLVRAKEPLTFRDHHASWRRMRTAALGSVVLTALMAAVELIYLVLYGREAALGRELLYLLGQLGCAALSISLYLYIRNHPCAQSGGGAPKE